MGKVERLFYGELSMVIHTKEDGIVFPVHEVSKSDCPLRTWRTADGINYLLKASGKIRLESGDTELHSDAKISSGTESTSDGKIIYCSEFNSYSVAQVSYHPLIASVHLAFSEHRPLVLSPDIIWVAILQGLAQHVNNHSEKFRSKFVEHCGKLAIRVEVEGLFVNSPESAWEQALVSLSEQLAIHIGEKSRNLVADFSTTTINERLVCKVALLDTFQSYFEYIVTSICGIPEISLKGTTQDWCNLQEKLEDLEGYELDWWLSEVRKIVDQFVRASRGDIDTEHWQNIYKRMDAYGGHIMNGWILKLIPYLKDHRTGAFNRCNPLLDNDSWPDMSEDLDYFSFMHPNVPNSVTSQCLPSGLSETPFLLVDSGIEHQMQFIGGFVAIEAHPDAIGVKPRIGWAVRKASQDVAALAKLSKLCELRPALEQAEFNVGLISLHKQSDFIEPLVPGDFLNFYRQCNGFKLTDSKDTLSGLELLGFSDLVLVPLSEFNSSDIERLASAEKRQEVVPDKRLDTGPDKRLENGPIKTEAVSTENYRYQSTETPWIEFGCFGNGSRLLIETHYSRHRVCRFNETEAEVLANSFSEFLNGIVGDIREGS